MHRRSQRDQDLIPLDPEIEAAACWRSGEARRRKKEAAVMAQEDNRVLRDYAMPQASGVTSSIVSPAIEANNFELNPALIGFVERDQFGGYLSDNPNTHLRKFLVKSDTIKQMLFDCGSSLSPWGTELVIGCRTRSPPRSPPGRFSPRPYSANTSHQEKLQSWEQRLHPLPSRKESPSTRYGRGLKTFSGSAPTMEFLTGS